jgi:hypothetical protein
MDYRLLDDGRLLNLLYTEEDRLLRAAVDKGRSDSGKLF